MRFNLRPPLLAGETGNDLISLYAAINVSIHTRPSAGSKWWFANAV